MAHSPGPWAYTNNGFIVATPNNIVVASVEHDIKLSLNEANANYKLMAAAPDLLEACEQMVKHLIETDFDVCGTSDEELKRWKDAIKKATA